MKFANGKSNIFFKLKRLQIKRICDKVVLAIRKCKTKGRPFNAGELLIPGFIDSLTMQTMAMEY